MIAQLMLSQIDSPVPAVQIQCAEPLVCVIDHEASERENLWRMFRSVLLPVRAFSSAAEYLNHRIHDGPCCLVMDADLPEMNGFELQQTLAGTSVRMVFTARHGTVPMCARAMKGGAIDFLAKPLEEEILLEAVSRALERSRSALAAQAASAAARARMSRLTPREFAVMQRVVEGMLNKQIAADLGIAEKTIKIHRGRMMHKIGVVSVPDLVRLVLAAGEAQPALMGSAS